MKTLIAIIILMFTGTVYVSAQEPDFDQANAATVNAGAPKFKFTGGTTFDFGTIKQGQKVQHKFEFTNTGKEPLMIICVNPSCGCTIADWPKKPVLGGQKAVINITFNSKKQFGAVSKDIAIQSNAVTVGDFYMLSIKGNVIK